MKLYLVAAVQMLEILLEIYHQNIISINDIFMSNKINSKNNVIK